MSDALQQVLFSAFILTWYGGVIVLYLRYLRKRRDHLRRFPPVAAFSSTRIWGLIPSAR